MVKRETLELNEELKQRVSPLEQELNNELNLQIGDGLAKVSGKKGHGSDSESNSESDSDSDSSDSSKSKSSKSKSPDSKSEKSDEYWIQLRKRAGLST